MSVVSESGEAAAPSGVVAGRRGITLVVVAETALAALTCLLFLGRKTFWLDEGYSFVAAHRPLASLWRMLLHDTSSMATYYLGLHWWLAVGRSEAVVRLPSVIAAVLAVPVVALVGRRLVSPVVGLVAGLLAALDLMLVQYAQEARAYGLYLLLAALSTWLFARWVEDGRSRDAAGWVVVSVVAIYTHYFAGLVVVAQLLSLGWRPRPRVPRRGVLAVAVVVICVAPLAVFVHSKGAGRLESASSGSVLDPARLLYHFSGSIPLTIVLTLLLVVAAVTSYRTLRSGRSEPAWRDALLWSSLVIPPAITLAASFVHPLWRERYLICSLPAFLVLVAKGLVAVRPSRLRLAAGAVTIALMVAALVTYYPTQQKQGTNWRAASYFAEQHSRPGDGFRFLPGRASVPFLYYAWKRALPPPADVGTTAHPFYGTIHPAQAAPAVIAQRIRQHARVWVLMLQPSTDVRRQALRAQTKEIQRELGPSYRLGLSRNFGPILVVRCYARTGTQC